MKSKYTRREQLRYQFDNLMSLGLAALIGLLALASVAFIAFVSLLVVLLGLHPEGSSIDYPEAFWSSLLRTLDPGTMGQDTGSGFRFAMLVVTLGGIFLVASLISIISNAFNSRIENLRKGRSRVLETDHTIILGWNSKAIPIVHELAIANKSRKKAAIVILSDRDKVETEDEIHSKLKSLGRTRVIVRNGEPMSTFDLDIVSPRDARSIIILAPDEVEDPDTVVIRTALALVNNPNRKRGSYHIVGEIKDPRNLEAARLVGGVEADWILSRDVISRITVQTSRQSGLSVIFTELLDFEGSETYFSDQPALYGRSYIECQQALATSAVMGIARRDEILLNPPAGHIYSDGDSLIVIAEDDASVKIESTGVIDESLIVHSQRSENVSEKTLILGYNNTVPLLLNELDSVAPENSLVKIVASSRVRDFGTFNNISVEMINADTTSRDQLDALDSEQYDHVIVLAYRELLHPERSDAKSLITLLHLRDIAKVGRVKMNIVTEMLDDRSRQLAEVTTADDFIVSDKLVSLLMAQLSENPRLLDVFDQLLSSVGCEICLKPANEYVALNQDLDFYTVVASASARGETAIGYRVARESRNSSEAYGIRLNPDKRKVLNLEPDDKIIVLAGD